MNRANKEILGNQLKAIVIFQFLNSFNSLEKKIKGIFKEEIKILKISDPTMLNRLYFFYGGKIGTYLEAMTDFTKLTEKKFSKDEDFKDFSMSQIIKINREHRFISSIDLKVQSMNSLKIEFVIQDCIIKFIEMRNKISHELENCEFQEKHFVELLDDRKLEGLSYDFLEGYNFNMMNNSTKEILSNFHYIDEVLKRIKTGRE